MPLPAQRDHRYAHVERFQRAIDTAKRQCIKHHVDHGIARLIVGFILAGRDEDDACCCYASGLESLQVAGFSFNVVRREREYRARQCFQHLAPQC